MEKRRDRGLGTVYWDDQRGRWVGQAWVDGRRRKVSDIDKDAANKKLQRLIHGDPSERNTDKRITVARLLDDWQTKALPGKGLAPSTLETHAWAVSLWTREIGKAKVALLDVPAVERALGRMADRGLTKASLVKVRSTLTQAFKWAERRRMATYNPAAVAEIPTGAKDGRERRALTADELDRLTAAMADHPWQALFLLSARVGLRPGEAAGVCTDALDLDGDPPTVAVIRAVQLKRGTPKLGEDLKTTGARRTLALPADVVDALRQIEMKPAMGLIFTTDTGGPLWPSTVRAELAALCETAKVPVVTPNELRHTAATAMAERGVPPHQIADVLGHRTTRMVDLTYRHRPAVIHGADIPPPD